MPNKSDKIGYVRLKERIPYHGKGFDELLQTLKKVLSDPSNKFVQKIILDVQDPHIHLEKMVLENEMESIPQLSLHDAIRNQIMEEYQPEKSQIGLLHLWDVFSIIHKEGLEVGFLAIGDKLAFQNWLNIRIPITDLRIFGIPLKIITELPEDILIVCGTDKREAEVENVRYCVKVNLL